MDKIIRKLIIKAFRSFPNETVEFGNPTFLVGRNGAGKSNLVDVFAFLAESMASPLQAVFDRRGGIGAVRNRSSGQSHPPNLGLGLDLGKIDEKVKGAHFAFEVKALPNYGFSVIREQCVVNYADGQRYWYDRYKKFSSNIKGLKPQLGPIALCLPLVGGDERIAPVFKTIGAMRVYSIEPTRLREMQDPDSGISLKHDGSNAASVLQELERKEPGPNNGDALKRIWSILESIVPGTVSVKSKKHGNKLSLEFTQQWSKKKLKFESYNMSDGTLRAVGLLMAVYQEPKPSAIVIEEPEATIHPGAMEAVLDLIELASRSMQVIVTTHSPELLDSAKWIKADNLRVVLWDKGASHVLPISESAHKILNSHLMGAGELLRSNALNPPADLFKNLKDNAQPDLFEDLE